MCVFFFCFRKIKTQSNGFDFSKNKKQKDDDLQIRFKPSGSVFVIYVQKWNTTLGTWQTLYESPPSAFVDAIGVRAALNNVV